MSGRTTSSHWVRGVAGTLAAQGLPVEDLFRELGIELGPGDSDRRWATDTMSRLWSLAAERAGNPDVALVNPHVAQPAHYGIVGYAMMSSPDLEGGLVRLIRYLRIVSDAATISLVPGRDGKWVRLDLAGASLPVPRQRMEYGLLTLLTFIRWMTGGPLKPLSAQFDYPPPDDDRAHREAFLCRLKFDARFSGFLVSKADLASPLPTSVPALEEIHDRMARLALARLKGPSTAHRGREAIARRLQDGTPRREDIARDLGLSDHTLQRRLADEATSFSGLVDETRRELAEQYLAEPDMPLVQIVYLLGYADQSNFFRACTRWFGAAPGEVRARLRKG